MFEIVENEIVLGIVDVVEVDKELVEDEVEEVELGILDVEELEDVELDADEDAGVELGVVEVVEAEAGVVEVVGEVDCDVVVETWVVVAAVGVFVTTGARVVVTTDASVVAGGTKLIPKADRIFRSIHLGANTEAAPVQSRMLLATACIKDAISPCRDSPARNSKSESVLDGICPSVFKDITT